MLNYIWAFMILGEYHTVLQTEKHRLCPDVIIESAGEAVSLSITMLGVMAMWCGIMEVARQAGLMDKMTKIFITCRPFSVS